MANKSDIVNRLKQDLLRGQGVTPPECGAHSLIKNVINMEKVSLGLRTAIYRVADINVAKQWYARAFNMQPYFDEPFYVGFDIGGYELGLQPETAAPESKAESVVAFWGVVDIDAAYGHFTGAGATSYEAPREVGGGIAVAKVRDPWGNLIGLIYNPHFKDA